jgi:DNA-binding ferritin-like protein
VFPAVRCFYVHREAIADAEPTIDLLTQRMQIHEKTAWMLRSMLE